MSKKEQYEIIFTKTFNKDWGYRHHAIPQTIGDNAVLSFIGDLDKAETESFIEDMQRCITTQSNYLDEGFIPYNAEFMEIKYQYPNVNIDDILLIPMTDMKELLEEWLGFIS